MRDKFVVRGRDEGVVFGLMLDEENSLLTVGGPKIFRDQIAEVLELVFPEFDRTNIIVCYGRFRWLLRGVNKARWHDLLLALDRSDKWSIQPVKYFRRLMH